MTLDDMVLYLLLFRAEPAAYDFDGLRGIGIAAFSIIGSRVDLDVFDGGHDVRGRADESWEPWDPFGGFGRHGAQFCQ